LVRKTIATVCTTWIGLQKNIQKNQSVGEPTTIMATKKDFFTDSRERKAKVQTATEISKGFEL